MIKNMKSKGNVKSKAPFENSFDRKSRHTFTGVKRVDLTDPSVEPSDADLDGLMKSMMLKVNARATKANADFAQVMREDAIRARKLFGIPDPRIVLGLQP